MQRRDFLNGLAWLGPGWALAQSTGNLASPYPPALTGLRGSAPGSMDAAHALAWGASVEAGTRDNDGQAWDLIVVGAGISGLSAAYFYRQRVNPQARILVLDNHDDFGGHARRNEFNVDGRHMLSYGGTQSFDNPQDYSAQARKLLRELGVDMVALRRAYDLGYFRQHGLSMGVHYDATTFGRDAVVASAPPTLRDPQYYSRHYVPGLVPPPAFHTTLARAPLNSTQRTQLRQVLANTPPRGLGERDVTEAESYVTFLRDTYQLSDPALVALLSMAMAEDSALGGYAVSMEAAADGGLLGLGSAAQRSQWLGAEGPEQVTDAPPENGDDRDLDGYLFHFPDGGATLARLLLQRLVPGVARFSTAVQCVDARFDYTQLDRPQHQAVNIRLQSTAVSMANNANGVEVRYVHNGSTRLTQARHGVMAGWSSNTAHVVQGLPTNQKEALRANLKMPMVYAQVVLRRWHALKKSGVAVSYAPAAPFQFCQMDFPVRMGRYAPPSHPGEPACLLMIRVPGPVFTEATAPDIFRAGRAELLGQDFAYYEEAIARQLQGMYGAHGFNAQRDIAAITVNRWGHGYVWEDARYRGQPAHRLAAKPVGRIAMAGADSEGSAYMDAAIDGAWRAVSELMRT